MGVSYYKHHILGIIGPISPSLIEIGPPLHQKPAISSLKIDLLDKTGIFNRYSGRKLKFGQMDYLKNFVTYQVKKPYIRIYFRS